MTSSMRKTAYHQYDVPERFIQDCRQYMGDKPDMNRIIDGTEISDAQMRMACQLVLHRFNATPPRLDSFFIWDNFPDHLLLMHATVVECLRMALLVEARNSIDFQDAGFSVSTGSKATSYQSLAAELAAGVRADIDLLRQSLNAEEALGIIYSPESGYVADDGDYW